MRVMQAKVLKYIKKSKLENGLKSLKEKKRTKTIQQKLILQNTKVTDKKTGFPPKKKE